jgi:hypothetical protein
MSLACSPRAVFVLLLVCVVAECFYVASFAPFPTVDSAAHIGSASALNDFMRARDGHTSQSLQWQFAPLPPNMIPGLVLAALGGWLGYERAETLVVLGYVIGLALALYWALRQVRPGSEALAFFALPFTFSVSLLFGFFNFSWSLVVLLVFAGLLLRERPGSSVRRALLFSALLLALYCTHLVGWIIASLLLGTVALAEAWADRRGAVRRIVTAGLVLLPTTLLAGWFLLDTRSGASGTLQKPLAKALRIAAFEYGHSAYDKLEAVGFTAVALLFWTLLFRSAKRSSARSWLAPRALGLLATILLAALVAVLGPEGANSGAALLPPRLAAIVALLGVLLLAHGGVDPRERVASMVLCSVAALWVGYVREDELRAVEGHQRALLELAPQIRPHSTIVQANATVPHFGDMDRMDPLKAEVGRLAARRHALDLGNVDLALPYFPLRFKEQVNPYLWMVPAGRDNEQSPPPLDLDGYARHTKLAVDYVLLAGRPLAADELLGSSDWQAFEAQLESGFRPLAATGDGVWQLWEAKPIRQGTHLVESLPIHLRGPAQ